MTVPHTGGTQWSDMLWDDFLTPDDVIRVWPSKFRYTKEQIEAFRRSCPSQEVIKSLHSDGFVLVAGPPDEMSLLDIRQQQSANLFNGRSKVNLAALSREMQEYLRYVRGMGLPLNPGRINELRDAMNGIEEEQKTERNFFWFGQNSSETFATEEKVGPRWLMLRKHVVPDSEGLHWSAQRKLIVPEEYIPTAVEIVWGLLTHFFEYPKKRHLLQDVYVRTSSVDTKGEPVSVGLFGPDGIYISSFPESERRSNLGVGSARRL